MEEARRSTMAEDARTLVATSSVGSLCTHSAKHPGFPYGSVVPYGVDDQGCPIFLLSSLAVHSKNLRANPKATLLVAEAGPEEGVLDRARLSVIGDVTEVPDDEQLKIQSDYLQRHPKSAQWIGFGDFTFYRLLPIDAYMVAGFGSMGWIDADEYRQAQPDPTAEMVAGVVAHMNEDHEDSLRILVRIHGKVEPLFVRMTDMDRYGFDVAVSTAEGDQMVRIPFPNPIQEPEDIRKIFVELVQAARNE